LLGIAATVTGGEILEDLSGAELQAVVVLIGAAVSAAVLAVLFSYLAAYGWPNVVEMNDANLLKWYEGRGRRLRTIARWLRASVIAAVASIGLLTTAAMVSWLAAPTFTQVAIKVTAEDDSFSCGTLLSSAGPGIVRLRVIDGTVREFPFASVARIELVSSC
jgi:hypothetical protein